MGMVRVDSNVVRLEIGVRREVVVILLRVL